MPWGKPKTSWPTRRGAALPTVLGLMAVLLTVGLALGTVSTLSLNLSRSEMLERQTSLLARSALSQFLTEVWEAENGMTYNVLDPQPIEIEPTFEGRRLIDEEGSVCDLTFRTDAAGFSTDNLSSETFRAGWLDRGTNDRSVPPYTLELILRANYRGNQRYYRALIRRTWPYAVFSRQGPVALMGNPVVYPEIDFPQPSTVVGKVYTAWDAYGAAGGSGAVGYGFGVLSTPADVLAHLEARHGFHPTTPPQHPLIVGMQIGSSGTVMANSPPFHTEANSVFVTYSAGGFASLGADVSSFTPEWDIMDDQQNFLDGDVHYDHSLGLEIEPRVLPGNTHDGRLLLRRSLHLDPLAELERPDPSGYTPVTPDPAPNTMQVFGVLPEDVAASPPPIALMGQSLVLSPDSNSTGGPTSTHYRVDATLSNRESLVVLPPEIDPETGEVIRERPHPPGTLLVQETASGIELQGCTLHVRGDLDLGAANLDEPITIAGNDATIIVDGRLVISNGVIDAGDQGFVLYARDIVLKAGGNYRGLMVAERSISILPQQDNDLNIEGGIMCAGGGGILLRATNVRYNPRYLKSVNGAGDFEVVAWEVLAD